MELGLESCPPSFTVHLLQLLNGTNQSRGWDLGVPTGEGLQNSIMDERILLLVGSQRGILAQPTLISLVLRPRGLGTRLNLHVHTSVMSM